MALTVLSVAYPLAPVGAHAVGGAEQVLTLLDEALVKAGHRSLVIACEGSRCRGRLFSIPKSRGPLTEAARQRAQAYSREAIEEVLASEAVDLVHMHGIDFDAYLPSSGAPVLVTLHLPLEWYPAKALFPARPDVYLHCVSASQRRACPPGVRLLEDLPNGVPLSPPRSRKRPFVLSMGRICPEKGFHLALEAAARAAAPLLLAGAVYPYEEHERYFQQQILPRLDERRRFVGPLTGRRKWRLLSAARCLLVPSLAPETSSLVAMEALCAGTPVIAFPSGALPEIIEHGRTGLLVRDVEEMARALREVGRLDPALCRRVAKERFSSEEMTRRYLALYERLSCGSGDSQEGLTPGLSS